MISSTSKPPRLRWFLASREARFLLAGAWNTLFGYLAFLAVYYLFRGQLGPSWLLCVAYAVSLVQAFAVQRFLVFRVEGSLPRQFLRFVAANSLVFAANLAFLPWAIAASTLAPPVLQAVFVLVSTVLSYFLHKHFSFAPDTP